MEQHNNTMSTSPVVVTEGGGDDSSVRASTKRVGKTNNAGGETTFAPTSTVLNPLEMKAATSSLPMMAQRNSHDKRSGQENKPDMDRLKSHASSSVAVLTRVTTTSSSSALSSASSARAPVATTTATAAKSAVDPNLNLSSSNSSTSSSEAAGAKCEAGVGEDGECSTNGSSSRSNNSGSGISTSDSSSSSASSSSSGSSDDDIMEDEEDCKMRAVLKRQPSPRRQEHVKKKTKISKDDETMDTSLSHQDPQSRAAESISAREDGVKLQQRHQHHSHGILHEQQSSIEEFNGTESSSTSAAGTKASPSASSPSGNNQDTGSRVSRKSKQFGVASTSTEMLSNHYAVSGITPSSSSQSDSGQQHEQEHQPQQEDQQESPSSPSSPSSAPLHQPDGWRVKLYRLNADGSWDDCGTGRIVCLYRPVNNNSNKNEQYHARSSSPSGQHQHQHHHSGNSHQHHGHHPHAHQGHQQQQQQQHATHHQQQQRQQQSSDQDNSISSVQNYNNSISPLHSSSTPTNDINNAHIHAGGPSTTTTLSPPPATANTSVIDQWLYQETGEATLCVQAEVTKQNRQARVLLRTRILLRETYQRQGDNIITWCEPPNSNIGSHHHVQQQQQQQQQHQSPHQQHQQQGVDLALSFQDNAGCLDIWNQITQVQSRAAELLRQWSEHAYGNSNNNNSTGAKSIEAWAFDIAKDHVQRQQQLDETAVLQHDQDPQHQANFVNDGGANNGGISEAHYPFHGGASMMVNNGNAASLPSPPTLQNLEEVADSIANLQHVQQREGLALWIANDECYYLKLLLELFPAAEARGDYGKLATLAACVKTILLLNDPTILELIVNVADIFEQVCSCLEYDPDLREKANHRWFLRERAKFRTVVSMDDKELIGAIHRSFRVNYLRDTLLRPTMDESSLSTLSSLLTFTHADVVKGVTMYGKDGSLKDSYLVRVIRLLGMELHALCVMEWNDLELSDRNAERLRVLEADESLVTDPSLVVGDHSELGRTATTWKQYLAPQDGTLASRRLRRRGCLSFLRELFSMVRLSLQQMDKEDFFAGMCSIPIDLSSEEISDNVSQTSQQVEVGSVASTVKSDRLDDKSTIMPIPALDPTMPSSPANLLSLLGNVLGDPNADLSEKAAVLEIIGGVAMHDPNLIRRHCLEFHPVWKMEVQAADAYSTGSNPSGGGGSTLTGISGRAEPNGVLLQVSEIMRIILDTDMMSDHGPVNEAFADASEGVPSGNLQAKTELNNQSFPVASTANQKNFLGLFYEHYVDWLIAPFQYRILHPIRRIPDKVLRNPNASPLLRRTLSNFQNGNTLDEPLLKSVRACAIRSSFAVELLSFCVRAHLYRMKFFLLKSRTLASVLRLLRPHPNGRGVSGDRCLKLAALRFLRAVLSVNDDFYHRHIVQHNLFAPVFEALRANPVGDNLVSSAIVEMCDYIHSENIKSLLEYIVKEHLLPETHSENAMPSLEDVSSPYVSTLTVLRLAYEANRNASQNMNPVDAGQTSPGGSRYFPPGGAATSTGCPARSRHLSAKALEDQRKFREVDEEESYFDSDDSDNARESHNDTGAASTRTGCEAGTLSVPPGVDEIEATNQHLHQVSSPANHHHHHQRQVDHNADQLHRTPRMFSLAQVPIVNSPNDGLVETTHEHPKVNQDHPN